MRSNDLVNQQGQYEIVYNLGAVADGLYLPAAFVVRHEQSGMLTYIQQRAIVETVTSFGFELTPTRKLLFGLIEKLQPKALEEKYNPKRRRPKPLEKLLEDEEVKKNIYKYVHRLLDKILHIIYSNKLLLTWEVERKGLVRDYLMEHSKEELLPSLFFVRNEREVLYYFRLAEGNEKWTVRSKEVIPITNHPAWLFVDYKLYRVLYINGNIVKPFREKDVVRIPPSKIKTYFQKFILKIAAKVDIEAKGFDIIQYEQLEGCELEPVLDVFKDQWVLSMNMKYHGGQFSWADKRQKRTTLEFESETDDIRIVHIHRDFNSEEQFVEKIEQWDLDSTGSGYQLKDGNKDDYGLLQWVSTHRKALEEQGFQVRNASVEGQKTYLHPPALTFDVQQENDWFDIYGTVTIGEFSIPFLSLFQYIRERNRFFPLPNGMHFLIPLEWMNKYQSLVQFGTRQNEGIRLAKSQFTLLEELEIKESEQSLEEVEFEPSNKLNADLRPYQLEGARWLVTLYHNSLGACLADDMGLGKTLQTITALLYAKENKLQKEAVVAGEENGSQLSMFDEDSDKDFLQALNALIILPASLVFNWEMELQKFAPHLTSYRYVGPKRQKDPKVLVRFDVLLTTYQTALRDVELLEQIEFEYVVLDESQQIKNKDSKIFKAINRLNGNHKLSLSGTPIENSLSDLWSQMQFINPNLLGNFQFFKREFITPIEKKKDEGKKVRLRTLVKPYLLRRTKEEVARDLPALTTKVFYTEMTSEQKKLYEREKSAARNYLLDNYEAENPKFRLLVLQSLTKLRQIVNHPKLVFDAYEKESGKFKDALEHWEVIRKGGHKALFFSSFVKYLNLFRQNFDGRELKYSWLTGDLSGQQREKEIKKFNQDPNIQPFLISIKSGGSGLNLTAADYVFILDPWWNPSTEQQAIARAHRIGQDKNVFAIKFITKESIEEKILKLQERKARLAEDIIDNVGKSAMSKSDIEYLFA